MRSATGKFSPLARARIASGRKAASDPPAATGSAPRSPAGPPGAAPASPRRGRAARAAGSRRAAPPGTPPGLASGAGPSSSGSSASRRSAANSSCRAKSGLRSDSRSARDSITQRTIVSIVSRWEDDEALVDLEELEEAVPGVDVMQRPLHFLDEGDQQRAERLPEQRGLVAEVPEDRRVTHARARRDRARAGAVEAPRREQPDGGVEDASPGSLPSCHRALPGADPLSSRCSSSPSFGALGGGMIGKCAGVRKPNR